MSQGRQYVIINYQLFKACYIETHPFERNVKVNARNEWGKLQLKWKLYNKSRSKWPHVFYVDARTTINNGKYAYELQRRTIANKTKYIRTVDYTHCIYQEQNDTIRKSLGRGYGDRCLFYSEKEDKYYPATVEHYYSDIDGDSNTNRKIIYDDSKNKSEIVNKSSTHIQPFPINHPIYIEPQSVVAVNNKDHWYTGLVKDIIIDKDNKEWIRGIYRQNRKIKSFAIQRYCNRIVLLDDINHMHFDRLSYSLQSFIKWVRSVQKSIYSNKNVIVELNWDKIETNLKIQCDKYENSMQELKHLYYDSELVDNYNRDEEVRGYFYGCPTIIHYILKNRKIDTYIEDRLKTDGAHIIKLLVKYKIIDGSEEFGADYDGCYSSGYGETSIFYELVDDESMVDVVTLICQQQNKAIITITHGTAIFQHIFHNWYREGKLNKNVLDKLIFRGVYPFEFRLDYGWNAPTYAPTSDVSQKLKQYITQFINEHGVLDIKKIDVYQSCVRSANRKGIKSTNETCIMVPLVLHPFICQAKKEMFDLLSKYSYFPDIVIEIINSYIYVNYDLFYPKTIHNKLKVKTINLFNNITHMKKQYIKYFLNEMGHDQKLMNYIFDNDKYTEQYLKYFWKFVLYRPYEDILFDNDKYTQLYLRGFWQSVLYQNTDCHLLYEIIVMNNITINQERMYDILKGVADSGDCKTLIEFLGLAKIKYEDKLDHDKKLMNYIFDNDKYTQLYLRGFWQSVLYQNTDCHLLYEIIVMNNITINQERMHDILKEVADLGDCKTLLDFLGLVKIKYGYKFDVNFIFTPWCYNVKGEIDLMGDLMTSTDYRNEETVSATMLYILREFDYNYTQQYSIRLGDNWEYEDLTLLEYMLICFTNSYAEIINCLLIECENKYSYSINDIQEIVLRVLHMITSSKPLMETIGNCLEIRCKTKKDMTLMNNILETLRQ
eukprot:111269_1